MIERWLTMADEGCELQAWNEITRYAEDLREEQVEALIEELADWPGERPMPYRWWEQRRRGDRHPWHRLAAHRVLHVDTEMLDAPDEYEEFDGGPVVDPENQPDFASGIDAVAASSDLRWLVLATSAQGNHESGGMWLFDAETGRWGSDSLEDECSWIGWGNVAAFSPDGSLIATTTTTNLQAIVWRTDGMTRLWAAGQQSG
ncbi:hypothetical protein ACFU98_23490 [Streptomyces sp. NPDC057575]|uniref:hypothetical protein n=1 Tax=unclassified Streptomyces TaxID=2593676 RepID=UPI00367D6BCE